MGLQSAENKELKALSRQHTRQDFEASYNLLRQAKFDNINIDVMFGIPFETPESLSRTLRYVVHLAPEHISLYCLKIEPGTPFFKIKDQLPLPDEDTQFEMYLNSIKYLERNGYFQYEISNFSRPGMQCKHNLKYWNCEEYLGLGVAAHSDFGGRRFGFISNMKEYINGVNDPTNQTKLTSEDEDIPSRQRLGEYVMLRLRLTDGISDSDYAKRFGNSFSYDFGIKIKKYIKAGYIVKDRGRFRLSPEGMFISNYILSDILDTDMLIDVP